MSEHIVIDDLTFELRRSASRRTLGITVDRGGELVLHAPEAYSRQVIEETARRRQFWVYTKLAEKDLLFRRVFRKEFVSGEGFHYLGRSYRLLLVDAADSTSPLRLHQGRFQLRRDALPRAREHFVRWYTEHGRPWIERRVGLFADRIGVAPPRVVVRDLGYRWGSCGGGGTLNFHWRTAMLPPRVVEYVVAHEMVHMVEPNHTPEFWARLERAMPDSAGRRQWLAENGGKYL